MITGVPMTCLPTEELAELRAALAAATADRRELADHWQAEIEQHRAAEAQLAQAESDLAFLLGGPPSKVTDALWRAEAAESQLAAVAEARDELLLLAVEFRLNPQVHSTYSECAGRITKALTPSPSHGAGGGK